MRLRIIFDSINVSREDIETDDLLTEQERHQLLDLIGKDVWIDNFPCRINDGDMIMFGVFGKEWGHFTGIFDNPTVTCHSFDTDEHGIYQNVWMAGF